MAMTFEVSTGLLSSAANPSFTHPGTAPAAVVVAAVKNLTSSTNLTDISAMTYGGVSMLKKCVAVDSAGELGVAEIWTLTNTGGAIPTGSQTVAVTKGTTTAIQYCSITVAASTGNITIFSTIIGAENQNSSACELTATKGGELGLTIGGAFSGVGATNESTFNVNVTRVLDRDFGAQCAFFGRESSPSSASLTFGWRQTADDWALVAVVLREEAGGGGGAALLQPFRFNLMGCN